MRSPMLITMIATIAIARPVLSAELRAEVVDSDGAPVTDAVVSLHRSGLELQAAAATDPAIMDQREKRFVPLVLPVQQGAFVGFPNSDNIRHHVYSFSDPKPFELELYAGRAYEPLEFGQEGLVVLGCNIHDTMIGYIYVLDTPLYAKSDSDGQLTLEAAPGEYELRVWHPRIEGVGPESRGRFQLTDGAERLRLALALEAEEPVEDDALTDFERRMRDRFRRMGDGDQG